MFCISFENNLRWNFRMQHKNENVPEASQLTAIRQDQNHNFHFKAAWWNNLLMQFPPFQHTQSLFDVSRCYILSAHWCLIESASAWIINFADAPNLNFSHASFIIVRKSVVDLNTQPSERELDTHVNPLPIYPVLIALHVLCAFYDERKLDAFLFIVCLHSCFSLFRFSRKRAMTTRDRYMILKNLFLIITAQQILFSIEWHTRR